MCCDQFYNSIVLLKHKVEKKKENLIIITIIYTTHSIYANKKNIPIKKNLDRVRCIKAKIREYLLVVFIGL